MTSQAYVDPLVAPDLDAAALREMYRRMLLIRRTEERLSELFMRGLLPGTLHLYVGQEAVAVGVCAALHREDLITSTHRGHGHYLAKGGDLRAMVAELFGHADGCCRGKGGSMHVADVSAGMLGANGIVGAGLPHACGAALAAQVLGDARVAVSFFGEGAANQGTFMESLNLAAIWKLPVVFVCENNQYTQFTAARDLTAGRITDRGAAVEIHSAVIDGQDVVAVYEAARAAVARARAGEGPSLLEASTYRYEGHNMGERGILRAPYRAQEEVEAWRRRDPIARLAASLAEAGVLSVAEAAAVDERVGAEIAEAIAHAEQGHAPDPSEATEQLFATPVRDDARDA